MLGLFLLGASIGFAGESCGWSLPDAAFTVGGRAAVLQDGVGGDRGAVEHPVDLGRFGSCDATELGHAFDHAGRRVARRRRRLVDGDLARREIGIDEVGEGAADVDADQTHGSSQLSLAGWVSIQWLAMSSRRQIQTSGCFATWSMKRCRAMKRPGRPTRRQCRPTDIIFGA